MTPVLPGYFGTVPDGFADREPRGAAGRRRALGGASSAPTGWTRARTRSHEVAAAFYRHQDELFGDSSMYKMDLLHEGGNAGDVPVGEAAQGRRAALQTAHPGATWVILGWQTNPPPGDRSTPSTRARMLIVDGLSDRYTTVTDRESDWGGTPYAFGSIWNFGGHTPIGANTPDWVDAVPEVARQGRAARCTGSPLMPEARRQQPGRLRPVHRTGLAPGASRPGRLVRRVRHAPGTAARDPHADAAWDDPRRPRTA